MPDMESIIKTVAFVGYLNALAVNMENGIVPFSQVTDENACDHMDSVVYIDDTSDPEIHGGMTENDIVKDMLVSDIHHAALHSYSEAFSNLCGKKVDARIFNPDGEDDDPRICLSISGDETGGDETVIVVENGYWYTV